MTWFSCLRQQGKTLADDPHEIYEAASGLNSFRIYSYKELGLATDNFNRAKKIGEGGFGCVYKGKLNDGKMAAIKVLSAQSMQGEKEFLTELEAIGRTNHANLIKLFGCCVEENHRILVFGYIENNSLALTLLRKHSSNNARPVFRSKVSDAASNSNVQFNWATRSKICIGIASGLEYLHEKMSPHIVHRDIKASNILLDKDLTPKISDFGLAKLLPPEMTHVSTRVAGTLGYLAPEYAVQGQLTRKADTYAFGVLILEIISGRCNKDFQLAPEEHYLLQKRDRILISWAWELYELRRLEELIDPALYGDCDVEEACRFLKIGLLCTQERPKLRPAMSSVVKMFRGEMEVTGNITRPGIIRDLKDLKVRGQTRTANNSTTSSNASPLRESSSSSNSSSHQSVHFTGTTVQSD